MSRPYLSFEEQPALEGLLRLVAGGQPFNLYFGAGVSIAAGLPSWTSLVDNFLAQDIDDEAIRAAVCADKIDVIRKADIVAMLIGSRKGAIRKALYPGNVQPPSGSLAVAVARLAVSSPEQVVLLTTNYDNLVEEAIRTQSYGRVDPASFTFDQVADWTSATRDDFNVPVMHLHGFLDRQDNPNEEPIILTESEFRKYGLFIRNFIVTQMNLRPTVFVGVSLTDPNVVGPLDELRSGSNRHPIYVLSGPEAVPNLDVSALLEYAKVKADQLEKRFDAQVVRTKSYGQVSQVVREMLAVQDPDIGGKRVFHRRQATRYGFRYQKTLKTAYGNLGCGRSLQVTPAVLDAVREQLTDGIAKQFRPGAAKAVGTIADRFKRDNKQDLLDAIRDEYVNMTLWLRVPQVGSSPVEYSIQAVGCSAFSHTEARSFVRPQPVAPHSLYPAVRAVFEETTVLTRLQVPHTWPTMVAVPLMFAEAHGEMCLGAVTMQSGSPFAHDNGAPAKGSAPLSFLAAAFQYRQVMTDMGGLLNQIGLEAVGL